MNLREAQNAIKSWQEKRDRAAAALSQFEDRLGDLALGGGAGKAQARLAALQNEVAVAESALRAAHRQSEKVRDQETVQRIADLRAQAEEAKRESEEAAAYVAEHRPGVEAAQRLFEFKAQQMLRLEYQAEDLERLLAQRERKRTEEARRPAPEVATGGKNSLTNMAGGIADAYGENYDPNPEGDE